MAFSTLQSFTHALPKTHNVTRVSNIKRRNNYNSICMWNFVTFNLQVTEWKLLYRVKFYCILCDTICSLQVFNFFQFLLIKNCWLLLGQTFLPIFIPWNTAQMCAYQLTYALVCHCHMVWNGGLYAATVKVYQKCVVSIALCVWQKGDYAEQCFL